MIARVFLALALLAPAAAAQTPGAKVTVTVRGVATADGVIRGQLCSDPGAFANNCASIRATAPAKAGSVDLVFENVQPGTYGLLVQHDENNDGRFSLLSEAIALGNGARDLPPTFEASSFKVSGDMKTETELFKFSQ